jgi:hypothetical protein
LDDQCVCTRYVGHTDIAVFKCGICQAKAKLYKLYALMTIEMLRLFMLELEMV